MQAGVDATLAAADDLGLDTHNLKSCIVSVKRKAWWRDTRRRGIEGRRAALNVLNSLLSSIVAGTISLSTRWHDSNSGGVYMR